MENTQSNAQNSNNSLQEKTKSVVKDFFLNLSTFVALYWLSISFIILIFQIINSIFPDNIFSDSNTISTFSLSSVIMLTPVFFYLLYQTNKEIHKEPAKRDVWIRRWLIYITLFVTGASIVGDGIVLINFFLNGDLTTRFILKVITIVVISGFIFWYLRYSLKRDYSKDPYSKVLSISVIIIIIITIIGAFSVVGSPTQNRLKRVDQERIQDLSQIQHEIISYWQTKNILPEDLDTLNDPLRGFITPNDPKTGDPYQYNIIDEQTFKICAVFETSQTKSNVNQARYYEFENETWNHEIGHTCFERTIDKERYSIPKPIY